MAAITLDPSGEAIFLDGARFAEDPISGVRPKLRGRFHQLGALMAIPLGIELIQRSHGAATLPVVVYALTGLVMFSTSASYHRLAQGVGARFWMRRADHAAIFVHVAGATTPVAILGIGGLVGMAVLAVAWAGAVGGAVAKLTALTADHDPCPRLVVLLGALPLVGLPWVVANAGWAAGGLLVASIATYGVGAAVFAAKSPDPVPTIFGYHEVWHVFTLIGGGFQLALTAELVTAA